MVTNGVFTVSVADSRDAMKAFEVARKMLPLAHVFPLSPKSLAADEGKEAHMTTDFEGQFMLTVYHNGHPNVPQKDAIPIVAEIVRLLSKYGDIKALHSMPPTQLHVREFHVEYFNADVMATAIENISGAIVHASHFLVCFDSSY